MARWVLPPALGIALGVLSFYAMWVTFSAPYCYR